MQLQPRRDTEPEMALRRVLHRRGLRYKLDASIVPGTRRRRVDIVFPGPKVAVFVDGCFWHSCPQHSPSIPTTNGWYWADKLQRNELRDRDTDARLAEAGWKVIRVWEHEPPEKSASVIERQVRKRQGRLTSASSSPTHSCARCIR